MLDRSILPKFYCDNPGQVCVLCTKVSGKELSTEINRANPILYQGLMLLPCVTIFWSTSGLSKEHAGFLVAYADNVVFFFFWWAKKRAQSSTHDKFRHTTAYEKVVFTRLSIQENHSKNILLFLWSSRRENWSINTKIISRDAEKAMHFVIHQLVIIPGKKNITAPLDDGWCP